MKVESHEPIETSKGEAKDKKRDESVGHMTRAKSQAGIPVFVLSHGPAAIKESGSAKEDKVEGATDIKERLVQEGALPVEQRVITGSFGHPVPKLFGEEKKHRQGKQGKHRETAGHGFQDPAHEN